MLQLPLDVAFGQLLAQAADARAGVVKGLNLRRQGAEVELLATAEGPVLGHHELLGQRQQGIGGALDFRDQLFHLGGAGPAPQQGDGAVGGAILTNELIAVAVVVEQQLADQIRLGGFNQIHQFGGGQDRRLAVEKLGVNLGDLQGQLGQRLGEVMELTYLLLKAQEVQAP